MRLRPHLALALLAFLYGSVPAFAQTATPQSQMTPEMKAKAREVVKACWSDIRTLCRGVEQGDGRIAACLMSNADAVSPGCREKVEEARIQ